MRILIVGGGIGGLSAALALARMGHTLTLVEKAPGFEPVGAGIVLAPNAAQALSYLGVELAPLGLALPWLDVVRADGQRLQRIDMRALPPAYGPTWGLTRPELHRALASALPESVRVVHRCTLASLREGDSSVEVEFEGGLDAAQFDLVVGADGLHSRTRELSVGPRALRYSGVTCWRGLVENPGFEGAVEAWGGDTRIGVVPLRGGRLYYFLVKTAPRRAPELKWPEEFLASFRHFRGGMERLWEVLKEAPPLHHDLEELEEPVWGRPRVLLLGDAAHAMTPNQGQGAAMAIEDALALAGALKPGGEGVLERYVTARQQRVRRVQLDSRRLGAVAHWRNPVACAVRNALLRGLPKSSGAAQLERVIQPGLELLARV